MDCLKDLVNANASEFERHMSRSNLSRMLAWILSDGAECYQVSQIRDRLELNPGREWLRCRPAELKVMATIEVQNGAADTAELSKAAAVLESAGLSRLAGLFREAVSVEGRE